MSDLEPARAHNGGYSTDAVDPEAVRELARRLVRPLRERAKLVAEDVREIRRLADVMSQAELAARFGVARATIANIKRRATWAWLD